MGTDYADFGNVHCIDLEGDVRRIIDGDAGETGRDARFVAARTR